MNNKSKTNRKRTNVVYWNKPHQKHRLGTVSNNKLLWGFNRFYARATIALGPLLLWKLIVNTIPEDWNNKRIKWLYGDTSPAHGTNTTALICKLDKKVNYQESIQSNSISCPEHKMGKEHVQKIKTIPSQEDSSFPVDGHNAAVNKIKNKSKTNRKRTNIDN